jgi:GAF domain-containing protein
MTEDRTNPPDDGDLRALLHRLNNQLGIILAHAELLERKAHDDAERARATEIVRATLDAMTVTRSIRDRAEARENS